MSCDACGRASEGTFCSRCVGEFEAARNYERSVFDMQYEWSSLRGRKASEFDEQGDDLMTSRQRRDFPEETRAMLRVYRRKRMYDETKNVRWAREPNTNKGGNA